MDKETSQKLLEVSMLESMQILTENLQQLTEKRPKDLLIELFLKNKAEGCDDPLSFHLNGIKNNTMAHLQKVLESDEKVMKKMAEMDYIVENRPKRTVLKNSYGYPLAGADLDKMAAKKLKEQLKEDEKELREMAEMVERVDNIQKKIFEGKQKH